jgi:hemerythrin-like metal-binding protein
MAFVVWSEMFAVHMPYIDHQHRQLLEIVNEFHAAVEESRNREIIFHTLNALIRYAEEHFRDEEEIMKVAEYPAGDLATNKQIHEQLVEDIFRLHGEFTESKKKSTHELEVFLNNWLIQHILLEDKKYQPYCKGMGAYVPRAR